MPKSSNQKTKLLYIVQMLSDNTDENHLMTTQEIIDRLAANGVNAERKSIYDDINILIDYGYDIIQIRSKTNGGYYMASREFELAELKLLVDAVQSSKFITQKKSQELIKKLECLTSRHEARQLQRQVYVVGRVKTENESIYYNVDTIHKAIHENVEISFTYLEWTLEKELKPKKEGEKYTVSPWALLWQDENYYLVAYDDNAKTVKHYRVDKMGTVMLSGKKRMGQEIFDKINLVHYTKSTFSMYGGGVETVTLKMSNYLIGVVIDRFGKDVEIRKKDSEHITVRIKAAISGQFFGWLAGLGKDVTIASPVEIKEQYMMWLEEIMKRQ